MGNYKSRVNNDNVDNINVNINDSSLKDCIDIKVLSNDAIVGVLSDMLTTLQKAKDYTTCDVVKVITNNYQTILEGKLFKINDKYSGVYKYPSRLKLILIK